MKKHKSIPFSFVPDYLFSAHLVVRQLFGFHALYREDKILLVLFRKEPENPDNGIWLATGSEHHASLTAEFPMLRSIRIFGEQSQWRLIPESDSHFESAALSACDLILKGDPRIERVPVKKKKKKKD